MISLLITQTAQVDPEVYKTLTIIFVLILIMRFILLILNKMLNHKIKSKIIDQEISNEVAKTILSGESNSEKQSNIKWFAILLTTGIGLFIANQFLPLGFHSIGIMTISIAIGYLSYSLYLKYLDK